MSHLSPELLWSHRGFVRAIARDLLGDEHEVDDVEQDVWIAALERPPLQLSALRGWLRTCTRRIAGTRRRRTEAQQRLPSDERDIPVGPDELLALEEQRRKVVTALLGLAEPYRAALLLRYYHELDLAAIAARLDVPRETVRTRLRRGRELLRNELRSEENDGALLVLLTGGFSAASKGGLLGARTGIRWAAAGLVLGVGVVGYLLRDDTATVSVTAPRAVEDSASSAVDGSDPAADEPDSAQHAAVARVRVPMSKAAAAAPLVTGRVVDRDGARVADAFVFAAPAVLDLAISPALAAAGTRSDFDGRFALTLDAETVWIVAARAADESVAIRTSVRSPMEITLVMRPTHVVQGTVRDERDDPVAGARVHLFGLTEHALTQARGVSDADGRYRLTGLLHDVEVFFYWCEVIAEGYAPLLVEHSPIMRPGGPSLMERPFDLVVNRGRSLTGVVREALGGRPIADAEVVLTSREGDLMVGSNGNPQGTRILQQMRTSSDGSFVLEHVPATGFHPVASHAGAAEGPLLGYLSVRVPGHGSTHRAVTVGPPDRPLEMDVALYPSATLHGRVVDESGTPCASARVRVTGEEVESTRVPSNFGWPGPSCSSDAAGAFTLELPLTTRAPTEIVVHARTSASGSKTARAFTVQAGEDRTITDLVLVPVAVDPGCATLRVHDPAGRPIPDARVQTVDSRHRDDWTTDALGELRLPLELTKRGSVELKVSAPGMAVARIGPVVLSADAPPEVEVELAAEHRLEGRLEFPADAAAHRCTVFAYAADRTPEQLEALLRRDRLHSSGLSGAWVRADGSFTLDSLPPPPWLVVMHAESYPHGPILRIDDETVPLVVPFLGETRPQIDVEGRVLDAVTGEPVPAFRSWVTSATPGIDKVQGLTISPGRFFLPRVPAGEWTLHVTSEAHVWTTQPLTVAAGTPSAGVEVHLSQGVALSGRVFPLPGEPMTVALQALGASETRSASVENDGTYRITGLSPGRYRIWALPEFDDVGSIPAESFVEIPPGTPLFFHAVEIGPACEWRLTYGDPVSTDGPGSPTVPLRILDAAGEVVFEFPDLGVGVGFKGPRLPPGEYVASVRTPAGVERTTALRLRPYEVTDLRIPADPP